MEQFARLHQQFDMVSWNTSDFIPLPGNKRDENFNQRLVTVGEPNFTMRVFLSDLEIPTGVLKIPGNLFPGKLKPPKVSLFECHSKRMNGLLRIDLRSGCLPCPY